MPGHTPGNGLPCFPGNTPAYFPEEYCRTPVRTPAHRACSPEGQSFSSSSPSTPLPHRQATCQRPSGSPCQRRENGSSSPEAKAEHPWLLISGLVLTLFRQPELLSPCGKHRTGVHTLRPSLPLPSSYTEIPHTEAVHTPAPASPPESLPPAGTGRSRSIPPRKEIRKSVRT